MADWYIFYGDGTRFSSDDGPWEKAPSLDVQVIAFVDGNGKWVVRHGGDFFRLDEEGAAINMDLPGMIDYVCNVLGAVKMGRFLSSRQFHEIRKKAIDFVDGMNGDGTTIH